MTNRVSRTISDEWLNAFMYQESGGRPTAKAATSTAAGLFQHLKGTWRDVVKRHRPDVFDRYQNGELLALRFNPSFSIEMGARFNEDNQKYVGMDATIGDLYLAHFLGAGDARKLRRARASTPVSEILGSGPINANPTILRGKTAGQVRDWSDRVMARALAKAEDYVSRYWKGPFVVPARATPLLDAEHRDEDAAPVQVEETHRPGLKPHGDYRLYDNQVQLKSMNYNPGDLDGVWGGGTAGAIAGFFNDYAPDARAPTKWNEYNGRYDQIDATIDKAESEGFRRPVTRQRAEADEEVVKRVAPEYVPAKQGFWAGVTAFFSALGGSIYSAFNWLMGYKDQADQWGLFYYVNKVPTFVWLLVVAALAGIIIYKTVRTLRGIEKPVTTGERM